MTTEETRILNALEDRLYKKSTLNKHLTAQAAYVDASFEVLETIKQIRLLNQKTENKC
jgi:hypothetical protein